MATALADRSEAELKSAAEAFVTRVGQLGSVMTSFWKEVARNLISKGAMSATEFTVSDPAPSQIAQLRLRQKRMRLDWDLHSTEIAKYRVKSGEKVKTAVSCHRLQFSRLIAIALRSIS